MRNSPSLNRVFLSRPHLFVGTSALIVVLGCNAGDLSDDEGRVCVTDAECEAEELLCILSVCSSATAEELDVIDLEILPRSGNATAQQVFDISLLNADRTTVEIASSVVVGGRVKDPFGVPIIGNVVAVQDESIVGRQLSFSTETGPDGAYELTLAREKTYRAVVVPADSSKPPFMFGDINVEPSGGSQSLAVEMVVPVVGESVVVAGRLVAGTGAERLGIPNMKVFGDVAGQRISSESISDENGEFEILLSSTFDAEFALNVRPNNADSPYPNVELIAGPYEESMALGDVSLGDILSPVEVNGRVVASNGEGVANASLFLTGEVGIGLFRRAISTDTTGHFTLSLVPGIYDAVAVAPAIDADAGFVSEIVDVALAMEDVVLTVEPRQNLFGTVVDADGAAVTNAHVRLTRIGDVGVTLTSTLANAQWAFNIDTLDGGAFSTSIDRGRYRVNVEPPPDMHLPELVAIVDVDAESDAVDLVLPRQALFVGRIVDENGGVVSDASVRAFAHVLDENGRAIQIGKGATSAEGDIEIVLPDLSGDSLGDTRRGPAE